MLKQIPNIVTLLNLFFGCMAIVAAVQPGLTIITGSDGEQLVALPEKILTLGSMMYVVNEDYKSTQRGNTLHGRKSVCE